MATAPRLTCVTKLGSWPRSASVRNGWIAAQLHRPQPQQGCARDTHHARTRRMGKAPMRGRRSMLQQFLRLDANFTDAKRAGHAGVAQRRRRGGHGRRVLVLQTAAVPAR